MVQDEHKIKTQSIPLKLNNLSESILHFFLIVV
jgi:hypothetical protein